MTLSIEEIAARINVIIFDVDGVLTPGAIIYGPDGEWKIFNVQDGSAFKTARREGLRFGIVTGRESKVVTRRAEELGIEYVEQGALKKGPVVAKMLEKFGVTGEQVCYVGDDLLDLPAMRQVGFPVAVANAVDEVKERAAWITTRAGGDGAAREVIDFILKSKGLWDKVMQRYIEDDIQ